MKSPSDEVRVTGQLTVNPTAEQGGITKLTAFASFHTTALPLAVITVIEGMGIVRGRNDCEYRELF